MAERSKCDDVSMEQHIPGGYILLSRRLLQSSIMRRSPLMTKLWVWLLMRASFKDTATLKRGQVLTNIQEMREAMSYYSGYRKITPTVKQIRGAYGGLTEGAMVGITKGTGGLLITILNYERYQDPNNYGGHNGGHNGKSTEGTRRAQDFKKSLVLKAQNVPKNVRSKKKNIYTRDFETFWSAYPKKQDKAKAFEKWNAVNGVRPPLKELLIILEKLKQTDDWKKDEGQYIPYPSKWLKGKRWEDEIETTRSNDWEFE